MKRYLFNFGYIGTRFRGIQRDQSSGRKDTSISRFLEESLLSLSPSNIPYVVFSSRTDAGVHSLNSYFSTSLCLPPMNIRSLGETEEDYVTETLNKYFTDLKLDIRIFSTQIVPLDYECRSLVKEKTYLYRLAVSSQTDKEKLQFPINEIRRCHIIRGELNIAAIHCACEILEGTHDFRHYVKQSPNSTRVLNTVKTLNELKLVPGKPLFSPKYDELYENFKFWNVVVSSSGFLWNQIRRIVGVLVAVGKGKVSLKQVEDTLQDPRQRWLLGADVAVSCGLYLIRTKYLPEALLNETKKV